MKNINNLMETCCQYKEDKCCCIIPQDLYQHRMNDSDFRETKRLMIKQLCGDNVNRLIVLEINDVSKFKKDCFMNLNKVIRTNVHLESLSLYDIWLDREDVKRDEYLDEYFETLEGDLGTSIGGHPKIHSIELSFKNTRDFITKASIHPLHGLITLRKLSVTIINPSGHSRYNKTVSEILSLKRLQSITMDALQVHDDTESLGIQFLGEFTHKKIYYL